MDITIQRIQLDMSNPCIGELVNDRFAAYTIDCGKLDVRIAQWAWERRSKVRVGKDKKVKELDKYDAFKLWCFFVEVVGKRELDWLEGDDRLEGPDKLFLEQQVKSMRALKQKLGKGKKRGALKLTNAERAFMQAVLEWEGLEKVLKCGDELKKRAEK